jgi:hypothetical protein
VLAPRCSTKSLHLYVLTAALSVPNLVACAGTKFDVQSAPSWSRANHRVSTFGVRRDGLMMRDGWAALGPEMAPPFTANACEVAYSAQTFKADSDFGTAVDQYIHSYGVTDELLGKLAPAAQGDAILFVTLSGHPQYSGDSGPPSAAAMGGSRGRVGMQGGVFNIDQGGSSSGQSDGGFTVDAVLFSVADKKSIAELRMNYAGKRIDDALRLFNARFDKEFPGARCAGWNWAGQVDAAAIKSLGGK